MNKILELVMKNPEMLVPIVKEYIHKFKPVVYELAQEVVEILKDYSNNKTYPAIVAKTKKNQFDAYVSAGFTEDQALALMINDNISLMKNMEQFSSYAKKM